MKKIVYFLILICITGSSKASTNITTSTVSGHWTLAGSPYKIFNNIEVSALKSLTIDPGVDVVFQGAYRLNVLGILHAKGTLSQQINFHVNDTTGWSDGTNSLGGWHGIQFQTYGGTATDSSCLCYCNITETKFDSVDAYTSPLLSTLLIQRKLHVEKCNFFQNKGVRTILFWFVSISGKQIEIDECNFYNNLCNSILLYINNYNGGDCYFHDCKIYQNYATTTFVGSYTKLLLENNSFYKNAHLGQISSNGIISFDNSYSRATIRGNRIYSNSTVFNASVTCMTGLFDIDRNLICNNKHTESDGCGIIDGGGGLSVSSGGIPLDSSFYLIRNNVIANNYSPFHGGGINVIQAKAAIVNNTIINNSSSVGGGVFLNFTLPVTIKNNVFYGNVNSSNNPLISPAIEGFSNTSIEYNYNWTQHSYLDVNSVYGSFMLLGDTSTNVSGSDPDLATPTITATVTENATTASFALKPTSPCINKGSSAGVDPGLTDYTCNHRIYGSAIDIGAFEYGSGPVKVAQGVNARPEKQIDVYPNPATKLIFVATPEDKGTLWLIDITGKLIAEKTVTNTLTSFDIHTIPRGIYFAVWTDGNGTKATQKIVVE